MLALEGCTSAVHTASPSTAAPTTSSSTVPPATATSPPAASRGVPLTSVNWSAAVRPAMQCATYDANASLGLSDIRASAYEVRYFAPAPGVDLAIVLARCVPGIGAPPAGLFAFDKATSSTSAHVYQVLIDPNRDLQASRFTINDPTITMAVSAYASSDGDCCPSLRYQATWAWQNRAFAGIPPGVVQPSPLLAEVTTPPAPVRNGQPAQATVTVTNKGSVPITNLEINGWNGATGLPYPTGYWTLASLAPGRSATFTTTIQASQYTNGNAAPRHGVTFAASGQLPTGRTGTTWTAVDLRIEP